MNLLYKYSILIIVVSQTIYSQLAYSTEGDALFDSLAMRSIGFTIDHKYSEAESAAIKIIENYPESPAGYLFRAAVLSSMMIDYEEIIRFDDFSDYLDKCIEMSENGIKAHPKNPWNYYYLGGSRAYMALHYIRDDNYFYSLIQGLKAIKSLRTTLELDSTLYDAYIGIGNYTYWISRKTEFLKWMPFISDSREEGIELMYKTVQKGKYSRETGASALAWILIDAGRYKEAVSVIAEPSAKHPDSRFFLYANGRAQYSLGNYSESREHYLKLLQSVRNAPINNHFNELGILVKLAENNIGLGEYQKALGYCREGLNIELTDSMRKRKQKTLGMLSNLAKKCENEISKKR